MNNYIYTAQGVFQKKSIEKFTDNLQEKNCNTNEKCTVVKIKGNNFLFDASNNYCINTNLGSNEGYNNFNRRSKWPDQVTSIQKKDRNCGTGSISLNWTSHHYTMVKEKDKDDIKNKIQCKLEKDNNPLACFYADGDRGSRPNKEKGWIATPSNVSDDEKWKYGVHSCKKKRNVNCDTNTYTRKSICEDKNGNKVSDDKCQKQEDKINCSCTTRYDAAGWCYINQKCPDKYKGNGTTGWKYSTYDVEKKKTDKNHVVKKWVMYNNDLFNYLKLK